jgi:hypothetical protein
MIKAIYIFLAIAVLAALASVLIGGNSEENISACTMDAMMCPDGSYVGRTGLNCEFVCPVGSEADNKSDLIQVATPAAETVVTSPLVISGQARGYWFFEGSFPVVLTNWDGLIIAEGVATAEGDWMTEEFVPFTSELKFVSPYKTGDQGFMKKGTLILEKDNPSGLPENDDALEIPVNFAE